MQLANSCGLCSFSLWEGRPVMWELETYCPLWQNSRLCEVNLPRKRSGRSWVSHIPTWTRRLILRHFFRWGCFGHFFFFTHKIKKISAYWQARLLGQAYLNLQTHATDKSGDSKHSSSFLKSSTTTLLHTISESEKSSYVAHINSYLRDDPFLEKYLPLDPEKNDLFELAKDGVLLWYLKRVLPNAIWFDFECGFSKILMLCSNGM